MLAPGVQRERGGQGSFRAPAPFGSGSVWPARSVPSLPRAPMPAQRTEAQARVCRACAPSECWSAPWARLSRGLACPVGSAPPPATALLFRGLGVGADGESQRQSPHFADGKRRHRTCPRSGPGGDLGLLGPHPCSFYWPQREMSLRGTADAPRWQPHKGFQVGKEEAS